MPPHNPAARTHIRSPSPPTPSSDISQVTQPASSLSHQDTAAATPFPKFQPASRTLPCFLQHHSFHHHELSARKPLEPIEQHYLAFNSKSIPHRLKTKAEWHHGKISLAFMKLAHVLRDICLYTNDTNATNPSIQPDDKLIRHRTS
jgi:hypothetical protein